MPASVRSLLYITLLMSVAGCTSYVPLPPETTSHLAASLQELQQTARESEFSGKAENTPFVDPATPLNASDIVLLAVQYNPQLRAARDDRGVAQAQIIQAGIIPNPQLSGAYGFLVFAPPAAGAIVNALALGLSEDIKALIVRGARSASAEFDAQKVDAGLLWQEWQTIGKARLLYVDLVEQEKLHDILRQYRALLANRYEHARAALLRGDVDLTIEAPYLAALTDMDKQIHDLDRLTQSKWQELDALLGLDPGVRFALSPSLSVAQVDSEKITRILPELPRIRPDLVALQRGYQSQDEKLRAAILGQFPALIFGGSYGNDPTFVISSGPAVTLDLPIFNRNQGNIAIERATRQKLYDEYLSHLEAAVGEIKAMLAGQVLLHRHLDQTQHALAASRKIAGNATAAFREGNIDERSYVELKTNMLNQEEQVIALEQSLLEQQVALATLTGADMPALAPSTVAAAENP